MGRAGRNRNDPARGGKRLLEHLLDCLPSGARGTDLLAETTLGKLTQAMESDLEIKSRIRYPAKLLDRALLWLHELEVICLNKGLTVFRPAMTIRLQQDRRGFAKADFAPLAIHYRGQILQIHVMVEFAQRGFGTTTCSQASGTWTWALPDAASQVIRRTGLSVRCPSATCWKRGS